MLIIGGGFGGLACARALSGGPVRVTLVDRRDHHVFTPLLYQVATALLTAADICFPFRAVFSRSRNVRIVQGSVVQVDLDNALVALSTGEELEYDRLVLAAGGEDDHFGNAKLAGATLSLKSVSAAQRLRNHVLASLEHAARADGEAQRRAWLTFVVVGGGPTGVEFAGALLELLALVLGRDYPDLAPGMARVILVEGGDRLLAAMPERLGRYAQRVLVRRGVEVITSTLVREPTPDGVQLSDGRTIQSRTIVWSAGVRAVTIDGASQLAAGRTGRLEVDERLRLAGSDCAFAIGDLAAAHCDGQLLPMVSPPAMQAGRYVARVILAEAGAGEDPGPFRYRDKGTMAVIGRNAAVASIGPLRLTGRIGWLTWLTVHIWYLIGARNRVSVMLSWGWNYVRRDRPIRMISQVDHDPAVDALVGTAPSAGDQGLNTITATSASTTAAEA
ncbi:MAG: NAD(P)/FAD-dependent oxidoreductase [Solirubrobacteraceae bacterium]